MVITPCCCKSRFRNPSVNFWMRMQTVMNPSTGRPAFRSPNLINHTTQIKKNIKTHANEVNLLGSQVVNKWLWKSVAHCLECLSKLKVVNVATLVLVIRSECRKPLVHLMKIETRGNQERKYYFRIQIQHCECRQMSESCLLADEVIHLRNCKAVQILACQSLRNLHRIILHEISSS